MSKNKKRVIIYKRKYGTYRKVGTAKDEKTASAILMSHFGPGRYRIGKSSYIRELKPKR